MEQLLSSDELLRRYERFQFSMRFEAIKCEDLAKQVPPSLRQSTWRAALP